MTSNENDWKFTVKVKHDFFMKSYEKGKHLELTYTVKTCP